MGPTGTGGGLVEEPDVNTIIQRLANNSPSGRLAKALTALGRAIETIYILRYISP
jgi:TnpA family transposase